MDVLSSCKAATETYPYTKSFYVPLYSCGTKCTETYPYTKSFYIGMYIIVSLLPFRASAAPHE